MRSISETPQSSHSISLVNALAQVIKTLCEDCGVSDMLLTHSGPQIGLDYSQKRK